VLRAVIQPASQRWPVTERIMRAILRNIIILMVSGYHESDEITFLEAEHAETLLEMKRLLVRFRLLEDFRTKKAIRKCGLLKLTKY